MISIYHLYFTEYSVLVEAYKMQYSIYILIFQTLFLYSVHGNYSLHSCSESDTPSVPLILISHRLVLLCNQGLLC